MVPPPIVDQVVDFYSDLFDRVFSLRFKASISDRLRCRAVLRQVSEAADAASQSLTRFFLHQQLSDAVVAGVLAGFNGLGERLDLARIANPNVTPESLADELLVELPVPAPLRETDHEAIYRVALHSLLQVLLLVGPIMAEWQKLGFSSTFELPRRVVSRLNQISEQIEVLSRAGQSAADERFELTYRDYLLQRFHRVEAGTVRMTTNLDVDLRELFVMPRVEERLAARSLLRIGEAASADFMSLAAAREIFASKRGPKTAEDGAERGRPALEQVKEVARTVLVGLPGSGKSTFLEWLQLRLAAVEEELVLAGRQAIPLFLRVRQLDLRDLPYGAALIEKATASKDRAVLMPPGWIERQMQNGRVLLILDGLDEGDSELRDRYLLPWLRDLCERYPECRYLISSRPSGYPQGALTDLGFVECDLLDFGEPKIAEYTRHWCTAVRLARNEPEAEARQEGRKDGDAIVLSFEGHPYISNLARNPLMLSAICLVNYFEGGTLPKDRAVLYKLCVEGLLHHWDQRRGIRSDFSLEEKLRACRNVALTMQSEDCAELAFGRVEASFEQTLADAERAKLLLEHVRNRTGLLLERRAGIFAFAHLTFQEYLAACAVHEGNALEIDGGWLSREHADGRWQEVIALYCGLSPAPAARSMIESLLASPYSAQLGSVLTEAYLAAGPELASDHTLKLKVIRRVAALPFSGIVNLERFSTEDVAPCANEILGMGESPVSLSEALGWLFIDRQRLDTPALEERLRLWRTLSLAGLTEVTLISHLLPALQGFIEDPEIYLAPALAGYGSQAGVGLGFISFSNLNGPGVGRALCEIFRALGLLGAKPPDKDYLSFWSPSGYPAEIDLWPELALLARQTARCLQNETLREQLVAWSEALERDWTLSQQNSERKPI